MTTKILIVNLGPAPVKVKTHSGCACGQTVPGAEYTIPASDSTSFIYVYEGQRVTVTEAPATPVSA